MAVAAASMNGRLNPPRPACIAANAIKPWRCFRTAASATASVVTKESRPAEYAIISTPTGQQLVEEGKWFALCSESVVKASSSDGQLRFPAVAVKRTDGEFVKGQRASGWVVEAQLIDEQAFALQAGSGPNGSNNLLGKVLGKVLVTKIQHTEETRRRLEEALRV